MFALKRGKSGTPYQVILILSIPVGSLDSTVRRTYHYEKGMRKGAI
jgi:hypothetical protein